MEQQNTPVTQTDYPYFPREISWLAFNGRVLQEAADERNPPIERLRFSFKLRAIGLGL